MATSVTVNLILNFIARLNSIWRAIIDAITVNIDFCVILLMSRTAKVRISSFTVQIQRIQPYFMSVIIRNFI